MNQELIDYLRGELSGEEAEAVRRRIEADPALSAELADLEGLLRFVRLGEEIEPGARMRERVLAAARRSPLRRVLDAVVQIPALIRFRFANSRGFRIALVSLGAHVLLLAILYQVVVPGGDEEFQSTLVAVQEGGDVPLPPPSRSLLLRLGGRRLSHAPVLARFGVEGQAEAIRRALEELLADQRTDGSFGDLPTTGYATLALLAEGHGSTDGGREGRAVAAATSYLAREAVAGRSHGAALSALVEDYLLSYEARDEPERQQLARAILLSIPEVGAGEDAEEALALARMAGFPVPDSAPLGLARTLFGGSREAILSVRPTRVSATLAMARGRGTLEADRLRAWAAPLFREAMEDLAAGRNRALAVLTLQAPYRL